MATTVEPVYIKLYSVQPVVGRSVSSSLAAMTQSLSTVFELVIQDLQTLIS